MKKRINRKVALQQDKDTSSMETLLSGTILEESRASTPHPLDPRSLSRRPPKSRPTLAEFENVISAGSIPISTLTAKEALSTMGRRKGKIVKKLGPMIDLHCSFKDMHAIMLVEMQFTDGKPLLLPNRRLLKQVNLVEPPGRLFLFNDILVIGKRKDNLLENQIRMDTSLVRYEGTETSLMITTFNGNVTINFDSIAKREEWQLILEQASETRKAQLDGRQDPIAISTETKDQAATKDQLPTKDKPPPLPPRPSRKIIPQEQWTPDALVVQCQVCKVNTFGVFIRRHHCRLCGRVICYQCSREYVSEKGTVRACKDCIKETPS